MGVWSWFFPNDERFFNLFEQQSEIALAAAEKLKSLLSRSRPVRGKQQAVLFKEFVDLEHQGDRLIHLNIIKLHETFITPIDREDIHSITIRLDEIVDDIRTAANLIFVFQLPKYNKPMRDLSSLIHEQILEINVCMKKLKKLKELRGHCRRIERLEKKADMVKSQALRELFTNGMSAVDIIRYKEIYERLESITDEAYDITLILEGIIMKHA
ncbi:MAG: DUF47 family protein [Nanoarchaeota archaeon]